MANPDPEKTRSSHLRITAPSPWVSRFTPLVPKDGPSGGEILDLAAGSGRHARYFHNLGHPVTAIDRDVSSLADFAARDGVRIIEADLESGAGPDGGLATHVRPGERRCRPSRRRSIGLLSHWRLLASVSK